MTTPEPAYLRAKHLDQVTLTDAPGEWRVLRVDKQGGPRRLFLKGSVGWCENERIKDVVPR